MIQRDDRKVISFESRLDQTRKDARNTAMIRRRLAKLVSVAARIRGRQIGSDKLRFSITFDDF